MKSCHLFWLRMWLQCVIDGSRTYISKLGNHRSRYVITKKDCRRRCLDASVIHGAGCNSDHGYRVQNL